MNTTATIQQLIDQAKKLPNGLLRNKLVSRLEDAKIVSELMDYQTGERYQLEQQPIILSAGSCLCLIGAKDDCEVHGLKGAK